MKRIFEHPPEPKTGKKYWLSLEALAKTPEFQARLEREFPQGAAEMQNEGVSRRSFLQFMGASSALAGLTLAGCRRPEKHLVPFTKGVEWAIPGKPLFYATSMPTRHGSIPLIATTHDGRPTKLEGNPLHPGSNGSTDTFAQASILDLYDPDRSRFFLDAGKKSDAKAFDAYLENLASELKSNNGKGLAFLAERLHSPTRERLREEMEKKFPLAKWCVYEPLGDSAMREAAKAALGDGIRVVPHIDKADVILALDSDFLGCNEGDTQAVRAFSARRRAEKPNVMNRLYVVESRFTVTGGMADHRMRLPVSQIGAFIGELAREVAKLTKDAGLTKLAGAAAESKTKFESGWIEECAKDLAAAKEKCLILVGSRQPVAVQLLALGINSALGAFGKTLSGMQANERVSLNDGITLDALAKEISDKKVTTLFILGGNPVYNAPADLDFAALLKNVPQTVRLGYYEDETSRIDATTARVKWHVPAAHYLETWGDVRSADGTYASVQPMILPLYDGWSELDIFARLLGHPKPEGPELVQATFKEIAKTDDAAAWNKFLHDGFLEKSTLPPRTLFYNADAAVPLVVLAKAGESSGGLEIVFTSSPQLDDGRYANNGWMQEMPEPITKLTWDNAAYVSLATAVKLGFKGDALKDEFDHRDYELVKITVGGSTIEIPIVITPGHADESITVALGYGRKIFSGDGTPARIATGAGVNAYTLRTSANSYFATGATVAKTGKEYRLAITQHHWAMEGRALVREGTLEKFNAEPEFAKTMFMDAELPKTGNPSLYTHPPLSGINQWGMVIDLNTCTGCQACIVACQAENNTPIVGKEQVVNGREMHWMRLDRYFASEDEKDPNPEMLMQPMLCQHCENAPCETVCPVNATVHSDEGLNVMAYNRCIGTRYCANNCPFKVRRFNFFDYQQRPITDVKLPILGKVGGLHAGPLTEKGSADTLKMQKNPNVTVRMRGVMEKCSFCTQRIQEAKIATKVKAGQTAFEGIKSDSFKTACQQACPAEAIVFGDVANNVANKDSKVLKLRGDRTDKEKYPGDPRHNRLLEYLNVEPRVSYLARIRNPNMKMPGADKIGTSQFEKHEAHGATKGAEA